MANQKANYMDSIKWNPYQLPATKVTFYMDVKSTTVLFPNRREHNLAYLETSSPQHYSLPERQWIHNIIAASFLKSQSLGWKGAVYTDN